MHIEAALKISAPSPKRQASQIHIHKGLAYLRASSEYWHSARGTLRMLEEIVNKTGLTLGGLDHHKFDLNSMSPFIEKQNKTLDERIDSSGRMFGAYSAAAGDRSFSNASGHAWTSVSSPIRPHIANMDLTYGTMVVDDDPEKWLNGLLAENSFGMDSMHPWGNLV
jgi:hypothetical protein